MDQIDSGPSLILGQFVSGPGLMVGMSGCLSLWSRFASGPGLDCGQALLVQAPHKEK